MSSTPHRNKLDSNKNVVFCRFSKCAGSALVEALRQSSCKMEREIAAAQLKTEKRRWLLTTVIDAAAESNQDHAAVIRISEKDNLAKQRYWKDGRTKQDWDDYTQELAFQGINTFQLQWDVPSFFPDLLKENEVFTCMRDPYRRLETEFCKLHDNFYVERDGAFFQSPVEGQNCSEWMKETVYWKGGTSIFKVSVNKPNYYVRFLCGMGGQPEAEVTEEHLKRAKRRLDRFVGIIILNDVNSYSLLRRWHYYERLKRVNVNYDGIRESFFDITRTEFEKMNEYDIELFAYAKEITAGRIAREHAEAVVARQPRSATQDEVMSHTDMVIPLKQRGILTRTLLEALSKLYRPKRLIVVTQKSEFDWLNEQLEASDWDVPTPVKVVDEDLIWQPLGLTRDDIEQAYNGDTVSSYNGFQVKNREFGWWYQQIIKLGIGDMLSDISENYYVWDADLIPMKRWKLGDLDDNDNEVFSTAILQHSSRGGNAAEYVKCLGATLGLKLLTPVGGGTFVSHHMAFNRKVLRSMLKTILESVESQELCGPVNCKGLWPLAIISLSHTFARFSEYLSYANYALSKGNAFHYHPFPAFGRSAIRIRGGSTLVQKLVKGKMVPVEPNAAVIGFSYSHFCQFADKYYEHCVTPTVIQLDHVFTDLAEPSEDRWNYYENYIYGCHGVSAKTYEESELAKAKVLSRIKYWWDIFERVGCIFVHIPRNAGTSVESLFVPGAPHQSQHYTAIELRDNNFQLFNKLPKFCTVRNPYDRCLSAWSYLKDGGNGKKGDSEWQKHLNEIGSFGDFVQHYFSSGSFDWSSFTLAAHFVPQSQFVCNEDGAVLVDACIELKDLLKLGLSGLGKKGVSGPLVASAPAPHKRSSKKPAGPLGEYDEVTADLVYKVYEDDFLLFNYSKDSWRKDRSNSPTVLNGASPTKAKDETPVTSS